eukprot:TRINITY_DN3812_c1_g4_i2.p1 TRINITY_DN3812_c1_g4~~TRINITY_DN3812_c1_g4_i2.p1  ORF type:complete len:481 (-),score=90.46 TRINITY_DN3812_c1_g4_i2:90-1532(-)
MLWESTAPQKKTSSSCALDSLPDVVVLQIFNRIRNAKTLCSLRSTCRRFQELICKCRVLEFDADDLHNKNDASLEIPITRTVLGMGELETLVVENPTFSFRFQELAVMTWCMHSRDTLEVLSIRDATHAPSLRTNRGSENKEELMAEDWKIEYASACKKLRVLVLINVIFDFPHGLQCRRFNNLKQLTLKRVVIIGEVVAALLLHCPVLQQLRLQLSTGLGPVDLLHVPLQNLQTFELSVDDMTAEASLELLRINAPQLEEFSLVVDCFPPLDVRGADADLHALICIESGKLRDLHLDLTAPFNLRIRSTAIHGLKKLQVLGDDWPWETVDDLLAGCGHSLEVLSLCASLVLPPTLDPSSFFNRMPALKFLSLGPDSFDLLARCLISSTAPTSLRAPCLEEVHVEYLVHSCDEVQLMEALLQGAPNMRLLQPIYNTMQMNTKAEYTDEEFRHNLAQLQQKYPHVKLPAVTEAVDASNEPL